MFSVVLDTTQPNCRSASICGDFAGSPRRCVLPVSHRAVLTAARNLPNEGPQRAVASLSPICRSALRLRGLAPKATAGQNDTEPGRHFDCLEVHGVWDDVDFLNAGRGSHKMADPFRYRGVHVSTTNVWGTSP